MREKKPLPLGWIETLRSRFDRPGSVDEMVRPSYSPKKAEKGLSWARPGAAGNTIP